MSFVHCFAIKTQICYKCLQIEDCKMRVLCFLTRVHSFFRRGRMAFLGEAGPPLPCDPGRVFKFQFIGQSSCEICLCEAHSGRGNLPVKAVGHHHILILEPAGLGASFGSIPGGAKPGAGDCHGGDAASQGHGDGSLCNRAINCNLGFEKRKACAGQGARLV